MLLIAIRRWFVTVPMLALVGFAVASIPANVTSAYPATMELLLQGPQYVHGPSSAGAANPGLVPTNPAEFAPNRTLSSAAHDIVTIETSESVRQEVARAGLGRDYALSVDPNRATVFDLSVETTSKKKSIDTLNFVAQHVAKEVAGLSTVAGTDPTKQVTVQTLVSPTLTFVKRSTPLRKDLTLGILGFVLTCVAAVVFDNIARRLRFRATARAA